MTAVHILLSIPAVSSDELLATLAARLLVSIVSTPLEIAFTATELPCLSAVLRSVALLSALLAIKFLSSPSLLAFRRAKTSLQ